MKIKNILLLSIPCFLLLSGCKNNQENNNENNFKTIEDVKTILTKVSENNNYSVSYYFDNEIYNTYHNLNYFYDTYTENGYVLLNDGYSYKFSVYNDIAMLKTPFISDKSNEFNKEFNDLSFDYESFYQEDNYFISESFKSIESLGKMISYDVGNLENRVVSYTKLFFNEDILNFELYGNKDELLIQAYIYDINKTTFEPISNYINENITPESVLDETKSLEEIFTTSDFNCDIRIKDHKKNTTSNILINDNYFYEYKNNYQEGVGFIYLNDSMVHEFSIKNNILDVKYDEALIFDTLGNQYVLTKELFDELYSLKRVEFDKFKKINDSLYLTRDYFNVSSFASYLFIEDSELNALSIKINNEDLLLSFYNDSTLYYEVSIKNLNNVSFPLLDTYIEKKNIPTLKDQTNNDELITLTEPLKENSNFKIDYSDLNESINFIDSLTQNNLGRVEIWTSSYFYDRATNYILLNDRYYKYYLNGINNIELNYQDSLSKDEYLSKYSFKDIDFSKFAYIGEDKNNNKQYYLASSRVATIFKNIIGAPSIAYPEETYLTIINDTLKIEVKGKNAKGIETTLGVAIIKDINKQDNKLLSDYISSFDIDSLSRNNKDLKDTFKSLLDNMNFTYQPLSNDVDIFNQNDRDYYTKDIYYSNYYKDGIATSQVSKYLYEYDSDHEFEDGSKGLFINNTPKLEKTIKEWCRLSYLNDTDLDSFIKINENTYSSYSYDHIRYIATFMGMSNLTYSLLERVDLVVNEDNILIKTFTRDVVKENESSTLNYQYEIFAEGKIIDINKTSIPKDAIIPLNLK